MACEREEACTRRSLWPVLPVFQIYRSLALTDRNNESFFFSQSLSLSFSYILPGQKERQMENGGGEIASDLGQNDLAVVVSLFATGRIR